MSFFVFAIVLLAAGLHASWNALVKSNPDKLMTTIRVAASAALVAAVALPALPAPAEASWPFIVASAALQVVYYALLARAYHLADMSQAYPMMRGTAVMLVAMVGAMLLPDAIAPAHWVGIALIAIGVASMAAWRRTLRGSAVRLSLLNAAIIAAYTMIDGTGARRSASPASYTLWIFLLTGSFLGLWAALYRRETLRRNDPSSWLVGLLGGVCSLGAYGMALWAMTCAPLAMVAALRESSILFATLIARFVLSEKVGAARLVGAYIIALGIAALRFG